jgi:phospholipid/cholesterol/gamma-HCH transport system substrate-binding protein
LEIGDMRCEKTDNLLVELQIKSISKSSVAAIYEPGFIAGKQISIEPNFKDKSIAMKEIN